MGAGHGHREEQVSNLLGDHHTEGNGVRDALIAEESVQMDPPLFPLVAGVGVQGVMAGGDARRVDRRALSLGDGDCVKSCATVACAFDQRCSDGECVDDPEKCNETEIREYSYFEKFMKNLEEGSWSDMPKCNFKSDHEEQSLEYCFQCKKYLCEECVKIHNDFFGDRNHIFIKQKIDNQYFCTKDGHTEYILDKYCTECNEYQCSECKCEHKDTENIFDLKKNKNERKIQIIKENIKKCQIIIEEEEKNFNLFLKDIQNKIKAIKNVFEDYKERNLRIISFYELLINNYINFNSIKNYNIVNNIINNNNFDFSTSEDFIKEKDKESCQDCINARYNKLHRYPRTPENEADIYKSMQQLYEVISDYDEKIQKLAGNGKSK